MDKDTYNEKKFDIGSDGFSPPDNESVIPESLVIRWPEGKNILKYHLQVCGNGDFKSGFIVDDDTLTAPSYTVTEPLVENRYYYWRVGIMNEAGGWEDYCPVRRFYIIGPFLPDGFETNDGTFSTLNNWERGRDTKPIIQSTIIHSGNWAARLGADGYFYECYFQTVSAFDEERILSFWIKGDCYASERITVYVDGKDKLYVHPSDWSRYYISISPGVHSVKWRFQKKYSDKYGTNSFYVDDIQYSSATPLLPDDFETNDGFFSTLNDWYYGGNAPPFVQSACVHGGSWAVQFGAVERSQESYFQSLSFFDSEKILSFWTKGDCDVLERLRLFLDNTEVLVISPGEWARHHIIIPPGTHTIKWRFYGNSSSTSGANAFYVDDIDYITPVPLLPDDFETNDNTFSTTNNWSRGGNALPFVQSASVHGGSWAARFGTVNYHQESYFQNISSFDSQKILSFWVRGDCSASEELSFYLDDTEMLEISPGNWRRCYITIPPGTHTIKWRFYRNISSTYGENTFYVDDIDFITPVPLLPDDFETNDGTFSTVNGWDRCGNALPFVQSASGHDGTWAVRFGVVNRYDDSIFQIFSSFDSEKILSFWVRGDCYSAERLRFFVDNSQVLEISPGGWSRRFITIPAGVHILKWRFLRNYSTNSGANTFFVDDIDYITPASLLPDDFETNDGTFSTVNGWDLVGDATPFIQSDSVHGGSWAIKFGTINPGQESVFQIYASFDSNKFLEFWVKGDCFISERLIIYMDGIEKLYISPGDWSRFHFIIPEGIHILQWKFHRNYSSTSGENTFFMDDIGYITPTPLLPDDFETNDGTFSTLNEWSAGGNALPYVQTTSIHGGTWAARFGAVDYSQESYFQIYSSFDTDSLVSFWAKGDCYSSQRLRVYIDETEQLSIPPGDWSQYYFSVPSGFHLVKWRYYRNSSSSSGENTFFVDDIDVTVP